jgi:hypothetical protein
MMKSKKITLGLILLVFTADTTAAIGKSFHVPDITTVGAASLGTLKISRDSIAVAQNEPDHNESKSKPAVDAKNRASGSGEEITENRRNNPDEAKPESLKPFVPSEEIPAEQAVDFPSDI